MTHSILSSGKFKSELASVYTYAKDVGPKVQVLLEDALRQASPKSEGGHGSCARLTMILHMSEQVKVINTTKLKNYIKAHADVIWSSKKGQKSVFKFRDKPSVTLPEYPWYEHNDGSEKAKPDLDVMKEIKRLLNKAAKEGANIKDDKDMLPKLRDLAIDNGIQWQHSEKKQAAGKQTKFKTPA